MRRLAAPVMSTMGLARMHSRRFPVGNHFIQRCKKHEERLMFVRPSFRKSLKSVLQCSFTFSGGCHSPLCLWKRWWCCSRWRSGRRGSWCKWWRQLVVVQWGQLALLRWNCGGSSSSRRSSLGRAGLGGPLANSQATGIGGFNLLPSNVWTCLHSSC